MIKRMTRLLKFGIVGLFNTGIDLLLFALLTSVGMPLLPAQWISYSGGTLNSYVWNRSWTFQSKSKRNGREIIRFIIVNLAALAVSSFMLEALHETMHMQLAVSKLMATAASILINYAGSRYWVFGSHSETESESV